MNVFRLGAHRFLFTLGVILLPLTSAVAKESPLESQPLSPQESLDALHVRQGYTVELVAAEPLVQDPVAINWGADGTLWIAEMADYPLGIDGKGQPGGRIRSLRDTDGDGKYDESVVFAADIGFPNGVFPWRDGVFVTSAPQVLFLRDTTGDGIADERNVVLEGFAADNQQLRVNGLRWGLDNHIYCASGSNTLARAKDTNVKEIRTGNAVALGSRDFSFDPDSGQLFPQSGPTQFGRNRDDWGNWFGSVNSYPLWHFVMEDHYVRRNPLFAAPDSRQQLLMPRNPKVYPAKSPEKRYRSSQHSGRFTSACSGMIYRDELLFPTDESQHSFVCEPFHNLVQHNVLRDDGVSFVASRDPKEPVFDFFASKDRWCRPVMVRTGPDGALWVVDLYRYVIEHPQFLSDEGKAELEPHYRAGHERGRIYRIYPENNPPRSIAKLDQASTEQLVESLESPNGVVRDLAQQQLLIRGDDGSATMLKTLVLSGKSPLARLHALCALDGLDALTPEVLVSAMADDHPGVRRRAVRLAELAGKQRNDVRAAALRLTDDPDKKVRLQLANSLGEWNEHSSTAPALAKLAMSGADDSFMIAAIISSIDSSNIEEILHIVLKKRSDPDVGILAGRLLALSAAMDKNEAIVTSLNQFVDAEDQATLMWQFGTLAGLLDAFDRQGKSLDEITGPLGPQGKAAGERVANLIDRARMITLDPKIETEKRLIAMPLMARQDDSQKSDIESLGDLLELQTPVGVQLGVISHLGTRSAPEIADILLDRWSSHSPRVRASILSVLPTKPAWLTTLLDAIAAKRVVASDIDSASLQTLLVTGNREQRDRTAELLAGTLDTNRRQVVKDHQVVLKMKGDPERGRQVFKKDCSTCHQLDGVGNDIGPNLVSITDKRPESLLSSILDPSAAVDSKHVMYVALTVDGKALSGILKSESGNSITLINQENKPQTILRSELETLKSTGKSLMPDGFEKQLTHQDLADVMAYVAVAGDTATTSAKRVKTRVGFAEKDISPKIGMERPGNYFKNFHTAFHDPCKVRVAVFDDGQQQVALVSVDALIVRSPLVHAARQRIAQETGIPASSIMIAATHSHSSGPTGMLLPGEFDHADDFVQHLAYEESTMADSSYLELVENQIVAGVVEAYERCDHVKMGFGSGYEDSVTFNRRFRMRNGQTYTSPRAGNPDIIEPAGPIDPDVGVIGVWSAAGELTGCVVNFSCHATTNPPGISANYIYYLEQQIRTTFGDQVILVFLAGASGDVNTSNNHSKVFPMVGETAGRLVGAKVGAEAVEQLLQMGKTDDATLAASQKILQIPRRVPSKDRVAIARQKVRQPKTRENTAEWIFAKETVLLDALIQKEPVRDVEIQAIQVGPVCFVTTPAEYFCQYGLDQKKAIDFPMTFPVSLANACVGYVPIEDAFGPGGGGYETRMTSYSNLVPTAGRLMANTGIELANEMKPDPVPELPQAPEFKESWSYGSVPPELE
tara:strand:- start:34591 stop:39018 length:4428 start_codon:yes stop_codon:yes gene_type:complete